MPRVALLGIDDRERAALARLAASAGWVAEAPSAEAALRAFGGYRLVVVGHAGAVDDDDEPAALVRALRAARYDGAVLYLATAEELAEGSVLARELAPCVERSPLTADALLRIAGWMRRLAVNVPAGAGLRLSHDGAAVIVRGDARPVGARGYRLLEYLMARAGSRCTYDDLCRDVYGAVVAEVTIRADVSRLRRALGAEHANALRAFRRSSSRAGGYVFERRELPKQR